MSVFKNQGFRKFGKSKFNFSPLVALPNLKSTTFSPLVPVLSPQEIEEKIKKKFFWGFVQIL
jgi:hypothetical protein